MFNKIFIDLIQFKAIIIDASLGFVNAYKSGNNTGFCWNFGTAGTAQHISAELNGKFYFNRPPLDSESLHVNGSYVTAVADDYSFDVVFERKQSPLPVNIF